MISHIVESLYAGVMDQEAWLGAFVKIADSVGATGIHLMCGSTRSGELFRDEAQRMDPAVASGYRAYWYSRDLLFEPIMALPAGRAVTDYMLLAPGVWQDSDIYNDFALKFDCPHVLATILHRASDRYVALSLKTSQKHGPFVAAEVERLQSLIPHIRQALAIKDRLERLELRINALHSCLDQARFGVIVLDQAGVVREANGKARDLMDSAPDTMAIRAGQLWLREPAGAELDRWMRTGRPRAHCIDGLIKVPRTDGRPISLMVIRLPEEASTWFGDEPRWMLLLFDPDRPLRASREMIAQNLGLSLREAEVARLLAAGCDVHAVAAHLNVTMHTVRSHLKSIYAKAGVQSQAELVLRIVNGPARSLAASSRRPG